MLLPTDKIFVAGAKGLIGSHIVAELRERGFNNLLVPSHAEGDLEDPVFVKWFFSVHRPDYVFLCAAKVGGLKANINDPLSFFLKNITIQNNVITNAAEYGVKKLLFLGSSCVYPSECQLPIRESALLSGPFGESVEAYGLAKVSGIRLCQWYHDRGHNFVSAMPCNVFGPRDNFEMESAHVVPGMMARMHRCKIEQRKSFTVWGDGSACRELIYAPDLAKALILIMEKYDDREQINAGSSLEVDTAYIACMIRDAVGYRGFIEFDTSQPTGTHRKLMDNFKLRNLGWFPRTSLQSALEATYEWYRLNRV
jgi:GDP-L-fucose synthase